MLILVKSLGLQGFLTDKSIMMKSFIQLFMVFLPYFIHAKPINDSVFHKADNVFAGEITGISGGFYDDLGTLMYAVSVKIDTVYKQNTFLSLPDQIFYLTFNELLFKENEIESFLSGISSGKKIFMLNTELTQAYQGELSLDWYVPLTPENHLKALQLADDEKIKIVFYRKTVDCDKNCRFCRLVYREKWNRVKRILDANDQNLNFHPENHRNVRYVLPIGEINLSLPTWGTMYVCFLTQSGEQVKYLTYQFGYIYYLFCFLHFEDAEWVDLRNFGDGKDYELQKLAAIRSGIIWEANYDTVSFPSAIPVCQPDLEYIRLWEIQEGDRYFFNNGRVEEKFTEEYADSLERNKLVFSLCLLNLHRNINLRIKALQSLARLNDPRAIPYLLDLAGFYADLYFDDLVSNDQYQEYLYEIAATLDSLTNCIIPYSPDSDMEQLRLKMGIPVWKSKIKI